MHWWVKGIQVISTFYSYQTLITRKTNLCTIFFSVVNNSTACPAQQNLVFVKNLNLDRSENLLHVLLEEQKKVVKNSSTIFPASKSKYCNSTVLFCLFLWHLNFEEKVGFAMLSVHSLNYSTIKLNKKWIWCFWKYNHSPKFQDILYIWKLEKHVLAYRMTVGQSVGKKAFSWA